MSKIKKLEEITDLSVYTKFSKDEGMFQIEASIYSMVSNRVHSPYYDHDITEIDIQFFINNKKVKYNGFKDLYTQLFGENTFNDYYAKKSEEFEQAYLKTTPYKTK